LTALELLTLINQVLFIGLFVASLRRALHARTRSSLDTLLLFGSIASVVIVGEVAERTGTAGTTLVTGLTIAVLSVAPLAMLRLVSDFRSQPAWLGAAGFLAFLLVVVLGFSAMETAPRAVELVLIAFFALVGGYATVAFATEASRTSGITRRRMLAVALGSGMFVAAILVVLVGALVPEISGPTMVLAQVLAFGSVAGLWLGFMPPSWLRRALREPELRRFIDRSTHVAGLSDDRDAFPEIQAAVAAAVGAGGASIGVPDPVRPVLRYVTAATGDWIEYPADGFIAGRAYSGDRSILYVDAAAADPENAATYRAVGATTALATPIRRGGKRLGVLAVYARREPIFAEDDVAVLELLADQVAILLETRALAREVAHVSAREEAARLKEEFLASAAHDLRSPLTVVLGQAEILERRVLRNPERPVDAAGVSRMAREARRLRDLVNNLLDAQRLEQGGLGITRTAADVTEIVAEVETHMREEGRPIVVRGVGRPLIGLLDRARILQVVMNLVENARKYGSEDAAPEVVVEDLGAEVRISVVDHGIGIPEDERERIFERFFRASNAQRVTDTGLGLGLYICGRIVEEHGGRIWHEPTPGGGSTFVVVLPLENERETPDPPRVQVASDATVLAPAPAIGEASADA
jgi:signal transduction histidine kinase